MTKKLNVYWKKDLVGILQQNTHGQLEFSYVETWLNNSAAQPLSQSLPLQAETFPQKTCRAFFAGVLPEDVAKRIIARNLGVSANNDLSLLEKIGGECAGAISFMSPGQSPNNTPPSYQPIAQSSLLALLKKLDAQPLLAGEKHVRLSMAGVQEKLPVFIANGKMAVPLDDAPSTHIIKPDNPRFPGMVYNEHFCMKLSRHIGLPTAYTEIQLIDHTPFLVVERHDRHQSKVDVTRLHQEDFCQAMRIPPENKYQSEGGPSLKKCFELLRSTSSLPARDIETMLQTVIFNVIIGNCDGHGKNFSLLYHEGTRLAPLYDLVCTLHYETLTTQMAMKIGKQSDANRIKHSDFNKLGDTIGLSQKGMNSTINTVSQKILTYLVTFTPRNPTESALQALISKRAAQYQIAK